ncbi:hypothetical protein [Serratia marcescens]|uniref:hypothetical protein n=1 Tax=Serratia marcescens TaxID=615 RepID=UPI0011BA06A3|nr:hypothetical protein [Serratia marcescens]TWY28635.1 hypothetical protein FR965_16160 [Serratia marcescens]
MASFSNNIKINGVSVSSTEPRYSNRSWTGTEVTRSTGIQYYKLEFTLTFKQQSLAEYQAFVAEYSRGKPFTFSLGHMGVYKGSQSGAVSASAQALKGSYQVSSTANTLEIGSLIQFTNHSKIYRIIGRAGNVLQLFPNLRENVQTGETILYNNLQGTFTLDIENEYKVPVNNIMSVNLKATEYL